MNSAPEPSEHDAQMGLVRDRFTRTADVFADYVLSQRGLEAERLLRLVAPSGRERSLDVACGPGTLSRIFSPHVRWIGGFDLTPAMLERARQEAASLKLQNFEAIRGNVLKMPFRDDSFDLVVTSYSMHHIPDAATTVREMARILRRGGRFGLLDMIVSEDPAVAKASNELEIARDPSHTCALPASAFGKLLSAAGLRVTSREIAEHRRTFDTWMRTAGWERGDREYEATRKMLEDSIPRDSAGLHARFLDRPPDGATDGRPDIELMHTALYLAAEKR